MQISRLIVLAASTVLASSALAQQPDRELAIQQFADRLMREDANGDGKLELGEMSPRYAQNIMNLADKNKDGFVTRDELVAMQRERANRARGGAPQPETAAGDEDGFHEAMEKTGQSIRGLRRSPMDDSSLEADLKAVQGIQEGLLSAKAHAKQQPMSAVAKEEYEGDEKTYVRELRKTLIKALAQALTLESALVDGDTDAAKEAYSKLHEIRSLAHDIFQDEDEEPERPGRGSDQGRPGRGG